MVTCTRCVTSYPDELVTQMFVNGGYTMVCGVCALEVSNAVHGTNRRKFRGAQAEQLRQDALQWRRDHPVVKP
jgi:hypothetical protein